MNRRALIPMAGAVASIAALTACSPKDIYFHTVGSPTGQMGVQVEARQGPDDGGGSLIAAQVVCEGETFVRTGAPADVNNGPNVGPTSAFPGENHYASIVWCPPAPPG